MTTTHMMRSTPRAVTFDRRASRRSGADPALLVAAALFLAVLIAEAAFIALAAPALPDIGSLYVTVT